MEEYAPIAVFVYNRPRHTRAMLESLATNPEFINSPLYIFSDGPKSPSMAAPVHETRRVLEDVTHPCMTVKTSKVNQGLARSISSGVSELCDKMGRVIVVEDDLQVSKSFLKYMNAALERYEKEERVMHISGYMYPVKASLPKTFFFRNTSSWGWATWHRAWKHFSNDAGKLFESIRSMKNGIYEFNICNSCKYTTMLEKQLRNKIDSWAICWDASVFINHGLCLYPFKSLVRNRGFDDSGIHCGFDNRFDTDLYDGPIEFFPDDITENSIALAAIMEFLLQSKKPIYRKLADRVKHHISRIIGR